MTNDQQEVVAKHLHALLASVQCAREHPCLHVAGMRWQGHEIGKGPILQVLLCGIETACMKVLDL